MSKKKITPVNPATFKLTTKECDELDKTIARDIATERVSKVTSRDYCIGGSMSRAQSKARERRGMILYRIEYKKALRELKEKRRKQKLTAQAQQPKVDRIDFSKIKRIISAPQPKHYKH